MQRKSMDSLNAGGMWECPGGKIAFTDEEKQRRTEQGLSLERSAQDAVIAELMEEKNIDLLPYFEDTANTLYDMGILEYQFHNKSTQAFQRSCVRFFSIVLPPEMLTDISVVGLDEDKLDGFGWFGLRELQDMEGQVTENSRFWNTFDIKEIS
jgi:8-oxo-dGTP pyrophosphatase MutT (NUDIX family)